MAVSSLHMETIPKCENEAGELKKSLSENTKIQGGVESSEEVSSTASNNNISDTKKNSAKSQLSDAQITSFFDYFGKIPCESLTEEMAAIADCMHPCKGTMSLIKTELFLRKSIEQRIHFLNNFHKELISYKVQLAKESLVPAPISKPLIANQFSATFNSPNKANFQETYISRSGRHTKRRQYSYQLNDDDEFERNPPGKRLKVVDEEEEEWKSKKPAKSSQTRPQKKAEIINQCDDSQKVGNSSTKNPKAEKKMSLENLSNVDIINRSKLFADVPKSKKRSRTEILFDNLRSQDSKKYEEGFKLDQFKETLKSPNVDSDENAIFSQQSSMNTISAKAQQRHRNKSSDTKEKGTFNSLNSRDLTEVTVNSSDEENSDIINLDDTQASVSRSLEVKYQQKPIQKEYSGTEHKKESYLRNKSTAANSQNIAKSRIMVNCPICDKMFPDHIIQNHASSCGETEELSSRNLENNCRIKNDKDNSTKIVKNNFLH